MKLVSIYTKFSNVGGAQKMCISIHQGLMKLEDYKKAHISSFNSYESIDPSYKSLINKKDYLKFNTYKLIKNHPEAIYISHHRKTTTLLVLASKILNAKLKIIHVAHNEFTNLKHVTFFPKHIIAVSNGVKANHNSYFKTKKIKVIYNGIVQPIKTNTKSYSNKTIKILISGRITKVKQQLEIVKILNNKIPSNVQLVFAGTGDLYDQLILLINNNNQLKALGHKTDMKAVYQDADYIMLYSLKEGLPLSLIEGTSYGLPILCNNVGGNLEILNNTSNGFLIDSLDALPGILEKISKLDVIEYQRLSESSLATFKKKFDFNKMINSYHQYILEHVRG